MGYFFKKWHFSVHKEKPLTVKPKCTSLWAEGPTDILQISAGAAAGLRVFHHTGPHPYMDGCFSRPANTFKINYS